MIDHLGIVVAHLMVARRFYTAVLQPSGPGLLAVRRRLYCVKLRVRAAFCHQRLV